MSDNGPAYVSKAFDKACRTLGLRHIRNRPYTPRTNGRAEWFVQTLCKKWAYAMAFRTQKSVTAGCPATYRSITGSGSTKPWAGFHLRSDSLSCSADEPGEVTHLARLHPKDVRSMRFKSKNACVNKEYD